MTECGICKGSGKQIVTMLKPFPAIGIQSKNIIECTGCDGMGKVLK